MFCVYDIFYVPLRLKQVYDICYNMKRFSLLTLLAAFSALMAFAQSSWTADNGNGTYTNPLFYDEFSDPEIIRVGDDYYLAGTTMHAVPGLVILHSKDLVNWENVA